MDDLLVPETPVVQIITPTGSSPVLDTTTILIEASDDRGIARVVLYINGVIPPGGVLLYEPYKYSWVTSSLPDSSVHEIYARAYDTDSNSTNSQKVTVLTNRFAPTNLFGEMIADTAALLTWNDVSSIETGFQVLLNINDTSYSVIRDLPANSITTVIPGIYRNQDRYTYEVRAVLGEKKSRPSNKQTIYPFLAAPSGLTIKAVTESSIELEWLLNQRNQYEEYLEIEERIGTGNFLLKKTVGRGVKSATVNGSYKSGIPHQYRVRAVGKYNISTYSNTATTLIPFPVPTGFSLSEGSSGGVRLDWKDNSTFEKGFSVERSIYVDQVFSEIHKTGPNDTTWTDLSVDSSKIYSYRIRAVTDSNASIYTGTVSAARYAHVTKHDEYSIHSGAVNALIFLPNSTTLVSGGKDGAIRYRDAENKSTIRSVDGLSSGIFSLAVVSSGASIASAGGDKSIKLWNSSTGMFQQTFSGHNDTVRSLHANNDGSLLVSAGDDSTVKIWNVAGGTVQRNITGHTGAVSAVRFRPNGTSVASVSNDSTIRSWSVSTGNEEWKVFDVTQLSAATYNKDGSVLAAGRSGNSHNPLVFLDASSGAMQSQQSWFGFDVRALCYSPDGNDLAAGYGTSNIILWHTFIPFEKFTELTAHSGRVTSLAYHTNGSYFASGATDGKIVVWKIGRRWKQL